MSNRLSLAALLLPCALAADSRSLKDAAKGLGVYIGTAIGVPHLNDQSYDQLDIENYDLITAENACKMYSIAKSATEFDATDCNKLRDLAKSNNQAFRAHNLVWAGPGYRNPKFVRDEKDLAKLEQFMVRYIDSTVKAIGDYPIVWDVINEAIDDDTNNFIKDSPWKHVDDFVCKAFTAAKTANPNVGRFYNDYNILAASGHQKKKSDNVYKLVKDLHDRDCGITGVGLQAHIDTKFNEWEGVKANMKRYQDLGLDVHITELDIKCRTCGENWSEADLQDQANAYEKLLDVCLSAANCKSFETWGFTDRYSWLPDPQDGLPLDRQMKAKPSYDKLYAKLESFPRDHVAVIARNAVETSQENVQAFLQ